MSLRFILIGHPVGHSVSPAIHHAAYDALGMSHNYEAVDCPDEESVRKQVARIRSGEIAGANVTVPHKILALSLADEATEGASNTGAANVLTRVGDQVVAHNTDISGLADELRSGTKNPRAAWVLGNGGAALAAVVACRQAGASDVYLSARSFVGDPAHWPKMERFRQLGAIPVGWSDAATPGGIPELAPSLGLIVQATSAGMKGASDGAPLVKQIPWESLGRDTFIYDLVYNPPQTPLLTAAQERGLPRSHGLGMLVGQAAHAFKIWLGQEPDRDAMRQAADRGIFGATPASTPERGPS